MSSLEEITTDYLNAVQIMTNSSRVKKAFDVCGDCTYSLGLYCTVFVVMSSVQEEGRWLTLSTKGHGDAVLASGKYSKLLSLFIPIRQNISQIGCPLVVTLGVGMDSIGGK